MSTMPITFKAAIKLKKTANKFHRLLSLAQSETLGLKMDLDIEVFLPEPKPQVRFYGAAAHVRGRALANILEFTAGRNFYLAEIELPQVQFSKGEIEWGVNGHGEVTIEGRITPAAIFANAPIGIKTKRIKLCPSEPWGMSFYFPGPVDWWTSFVLFTSKTVMEITVMKAKPLPALPIAGNPVGVRSPTRAEIDEMIAEWLA